MKRVELKCWCFWFVALVLLLFASSCKSRDVKNSKSSVETETASEQNQSNKVVDNSQEATKSNQEKEIDKKTNETVKKSAYKLTPVDKDKPIVITDSDGNETSISNAVVESEDSEATTETSEKQKESTVSEASKLNDIVSKSNSSNKANAKAKADARTKESDSEALSVLSFWWVGLLFILALLGWFIYKKVKNNGWKTVFNTK